MTPCLCVLYMRGRKIERERCYLSAGAGNGKKPPLLCTLQHYIARGTYMCARTPHRETTRLSLAALSQTRCLSLARCCLWSEPPKPLCREKERERERCYVAIAVAVCDHWLRDAHARGWGERGTVGDMRRWLSGFFKWSEVWITSEGLKEMSSVCIYR